MQDAGRYRSNAAECVLAAQKTSNFRYRKLNLTLAATWLTLARQGEAMDDLAAIWDGEDEPVKADRVVA
jgi:hypothetical protein